MLTAAFAFAAIRIALAILLETTALVIWDIGTRSPPRLLRDIRAGIGDAPSVVRGAVRFFAGAGTLLAGALVCAPVALRPIDLTIIECWAIVTALGLETLIGPDLRTARRQRRSAPADVQ